IGRAVIRLRGRGELEAHRHAHDEIALEPVGVRLAAAQGIADESHALREPGVFELPAELGREQLRDLVLEAPARAVGEWKIVRVLADAQHALGCARQLALLRKSNPGEEKKSRCGGKRAAGPLHFNSSRRPGWMAPSERPLR